MDCRFWYKQLDDWRLEIDTYSCEDEIFNTTETSLVIKKRTCERIIHTILLTIMCLILSVILLLLLLLVAITIVQNIGYEHLYLLCLDWHDEYKKSWFK